MAMAKSAVSRLTGLEGYFSFFATLRLIRFIKKFSPDLIHLRNLHGHYLNLPLLFRFLKKSALPVVVHLHDCWILSGGCTHPTSHDCGGWLTACRSCPAKKEYPESLFFDFSGKMLKDKKKWFGGLKNVTVVGVSKWVAGEGEKSYLKQFPTTFIYNWIDTQIFKPGPSDVMDKYGLNKDKFHIICVAATWGRDSEKYRELLQLADRIDPDMQIIAVGKTYDPEPRENIRYIGFTDSTRELAQLYSACDAYVHLSTADTFGKVIAEAMACGLPAIVYDRTACPEVVGEDCGFAVDAHDIDAAAEKLREIRNRGKAYYESRCAARVREHFEYRTNCRKTLELYERMIGPGK